MGQEQPSKPLIFSTTRFVHISRATNKYWSLRLQVKNHYWVVSLSGLVWQDKTKKRKETKHFLCNEINVPNLLALRYHKMSHFPSKHCI